MSVQVDADPPEDDWDIVFANRDNTCALKTSGELYCWGRNTDKQIREAAGSVTAPFLIETSAGSADTDWTEAATGNSTCAIKASGALYCWGRNAEGQLADGTFSATGTPKLVQGEADYEHIRIGVATVCALASPREGQGGLVRCWGRNTAGQIVPGGAAYLTVPTDTAFPSEIRDVTVGSSHVCAVDADQRLECMGSGTFGETGKGELGLSTTHAPAQTTSSKLLAAYGESSCVITATDDLQCWGIGDVGQLGVGDTASADLPKDASQTVKVKTVALGRKHACEITTSNALRCAGSNPNGQLGTNQTTPSTSFNAITTAGKPWAALAWSKLAAGESHNCAISTGSALWCWGRNNEAQLGQAAAPALGDLVHVTTTDNWSSVALGAFHTCGRRSDGTLLCWGRNSSGEVGNNTLDATSLPFSHGIGWTGAIGAGVNHTCAIRSPGELYCWGENGNSQLGDGTTVDKLVPTRIGTDSDWVEVGAANAFSCARKTSGAVYCWGVDTTGQLGVGDVATRTRPTQIASDLTFGSIALGYSHACARVVDGAVHCWGTSELGQLGKGGAWGYAPEWVVEP